MRDRIIGELGGVAHPQLLVYLMGPYTAFDIRTALEQADDPTDVIDLSALPDSFDFSTVTDADAVLDRDEAMLDLMLAVRDRLRTDPGVNAFLALDVDLPLSEMDAATQSIEFALASNAVIYLVPKLGDNLGVGIETGAVLEAIFQRDAATDTGHDERVLFIHESGIRSAMIAAVIDRWDAQVHTYDDRDELVRKVRLFVRDIARKEQTGTLPRLQ